MALTGKLLADFSSFQDAVQKAEVSLRGMETGAGKVSTSLNRMVDSFSGRKLIQDATLAAEAVERIGGTSKLTETELQRLASQAQEAAAKMKALGVEVPAGLQKIADEAKKAESGLSSLGGSLSKLAGAVGIGLSVGAVVNFGKSVFDSASKVHDLSEQLGISVEAVQGFKFAAEQSGSSLDAVGTALTKMNQNLAGGDKATVQALKDAGLRFSDIRNMKPEDAFLAIADAIQKIPDPMKQSDVALQLFGKGAASLLPGIKEGFRGAAAAADKMSTDTVNALEAAQDAWESLGNKVTIISGTIIATTLNTASKVTSSWRDFVMFAENAIKFGVGNAGAMADMAVAADKAVASQEKLAGALPKTTQLTKEQQDAIEKHAKAIEDLNEKITHAKEIKLLDEYLTLKSSKATPGQLREIAQEAEDLFQKGGRLSPQLFQLVLRFTDLGLKVTTSADALGSLGFKMDAAIGPMTALNEATKEFAAHLKLGADGMSGLGFAAETGFEKFKKKGAEAKDTLGQLSSAFSQLSQIAGGSFGGILKDIGTAISTLNTTVKMVQSLQSALATTTVAQGASGAGAGSNLASGAGGYVAGGLLAGAFAIMAADKKWQQEQAQIDVTRGSVGTGLEQAYGGMSNLQRLSKQVGMDWKAIWDASFIHNTLKGLQDFQNAAADLDQKLKALDKDAQQFGLTWKDLVEPADLQAGFGQAAKTIYDSFERLMMAGYSTDAIVKGMSGSLNTLIADALSAGVKIPAGLEPVIDQLITMGKLTDDNARKLLGLGGDLAGGSFDEITAAANRYGISLDSLGAKVNQINIDQLSTQLSKDWKTLTSDGEDVNAVMKGMQKQVNEVVRAALKFGDTVPESMRPMLEAMLKAGLLTDGAGHKLKDLSGITFAAPITDKIDELISKMGDFIDSIIGPDGAGAALGRLGRTKVPPIEVPWRYRKDGGDEPPGAGRDKSVTVESKVIMDREVVATAIGRSAFS